MPILPSNMTGAVTIVPPPPGFSLRNLSGPQTLSSNLKIVFMGDSLLTDSPGASFDPSLVLTGMIEQEIIRQNANREVTFEFVNRAWGGRTWTNTQAVINDIIAGGAPPPEWDIGTGTDTWLEFVEDDAPDILIVNLGMNDAQIISGGVFTKAMIDQTRTWAKPPALILVSVMLPNSLSSNSSISGEVEQEGRLRGAQIIRTMAATEGVGLLDLGRYQTMITRGFDPATSVLREGDGVAQTTVIPFTSPDVCQDYAAVMTFTATNAFWNRRMIFSTASTVLGTNTKVEVYATGGFMAVDLFCETSGAYKTVVSTVPRPVSGSFTLNFCLKNGWLRVSIGTAVIYSGLIRHGGGRYNPTITWNTGGNVPVQMLWYPGQFLQTFAATDELLFWGSTAIAGGIEGGNDLNHPTALGWQLVRPLIEHCDWRIPVAFEGVATIPTLNQARIGVGTNKPSGIMEVQKTPVTTAATPAVTGNVLVLSDESAVGMTMRTGTSGAARMFFSVGANNDIAGIIVDNTGDFRIRANDVELVRVTAGSADGFASMQLQCNVGGTLQNEQVRFAPVGSLPAGAQVLYVVI